MKIKVAKNMCSADGNTFYPKIRISMPKDSKYQDYYIELPDYCVSTATNYNELYFKDDRDIKLIKTHREEGKRYERPSLTSDELKQEFAQHEKQFDKSIYPQALAYVNDYDYQRGIEWNRNGQFVVGNIDGVWFWKGDDDKRRISANNFELIKTLSESEAEGVTQDIARLQDTTNRLSRLSEFNGIKSKFDSLLKHDITRDCPELIDTAKELQDGMTGLIKTLTQDKEDIEQKFWSMQQVQVNQVKEEIIIKSGSKKNKKNEAER